MTDEMVEFLKPQDMKNSIITWNYYKSKYIQKYNKTSLFLINFILTQITNSCIGSNQHMLDLVAIFKFLGPLGPAIHFFVCSSSYLVRIWVVIVDPYIKS